jgi:hypothetical protein
MRTLVYVRRILFVLVAVLAAAIPQMTEAAPCSATMPVSSITKTTNGNIRITWVSDTNDVYVAQYTTNLTWFNQWFVGQDNITNQGTSTTWEDAGGSYPAPSDPSVTKRFYRILRKDADYGMPCVNLLSPTNGATVSGIINVGVAASDDSRISSVTLVIDGDDYATITDGPMSFPVNTAMFTNGTHSIYARAADNVGIPSLGGNPDSDVVANVVTSETVQVSFQNNVVLDSFELFQSQLPISARLAYSNANWSVEIERENGTIAKTFSGSTSNGLIEITWDGTDGAGNPVAEKAVYFVNVSAVPLSGSGLLFASGTTTDTVTKATYREASTTTQTTLLTRQKLKNFLWEGVSAAKLSTISTTISMADANSGIYQETIFVMQTDNDWTDLLNNLADPDPREVTQLYYNGHANAEKIGFQEYTPNRGLDTTDVTVRLNNLYYFSPKKGTWVATFSTPYKFVFLDGCLSGNGTWPRAFGILKNQMSYSTVGARNRAFLGWARITVSSLFGNTHDNFTKRFWQRWTEDVTKTFAVALQQAVDQTPGIEASQLVRYGYQNLTWEQ